MLGFFGFIMATMVFAGYGITSILVSEHLKGQFKINNYFFGYVSAAFATLCWAIATLLSGELFTIFIALGNMFLLFATIILFTTLQKKPNLLILGALMALSITAFIYRVFIVGVDAVIENSLLIFNTPKLFGAFLIIVFIIIWHLSNKMYFSNLLKDSLYTKVLYPLYNSFSIMALIAVSGFLFAKKPLTLVLSFSMLIFAYTMLIAMNIVTSKTLKGDKNNAK